MNSSLADKVQQVLAGIPKRKPSKTPWFAKQKSGGILLFSAKQKRIGYLQPDDAKKFEAAVERTLAYTRKREAELIEKFFHLTGKQPSDRS